MTGVQFRANPKLKSKIPVQNRISGEKNSSVRVHLVNPNHLSFGVGVITPRWLYVIAAATPHAFGDPRLVDETLEPTDFTEIKPGDVVGIGIHSGNALRGYEVGQMARERRTPS